MTLNDFELQKYPWIFSDFMRFLAAEEWIATKWMEADQDYPRTETAIGCRASHEH